MANKTDRGVTMTPIFQYAKNNGLDEKEFFDFIKSKWGEEGSKGLSLESEVPHGTLESFFDEYANEKFEKKANEKMPELIKEYAEKGLTLTPKDEEPKIEKPEVEDIDTNDNDKVEVDELDAYTKDLEDYLDKNPDAKKKNYY